MSGFFFGLRRLTVSFVICQLCSTSALAADVDLAQRHVNKQMTCLACHDKANPEPFSEVENSKCLGCHGDLKQLQKRSFVKYGKNNPHESHLGDVSCGICHKGHGPSSVYCENCHKDFKLIIR